MHSVHPATIGFYRTSFPIKVIIVLLILVIFCQAIVIQRLCHQKMSGHKVCNQTGNVLLFPIWNSKQ